MSEQTGTPVAVNPGAEPKPWYASTRFTGPLGLVLALLAWQLLPAPADYPLVPAMTGVAVWMAVWWVFEVVPIPVTALLPLILLPLSDIAPLKVVSANYGKPIIFLFLGGFMLALALERSELHRRIALNIVRLIGQQPRRLLLGFMLASASLSMWISNTASVMVMLPIGLSVIGQAKAANNRGFKTALMLGIAYGANIGGMATPVGTPPNLVFLEVFRKLFPNAPEVGFAQWMTIGLPVTFVFILLAWWVLSFVVFKLPAAATDSSAGASATENDGIAAAYKALGPMRKDEWFAGGIFALAAVLWVTGSDLHLGGWTLPGWRSTLGLAQFGDASVAVACAMLLFIVPSTDRPGETLLDWHTAQHRTPWALILLFGGGFALAGGFKSSGLSATIGGGVSGLIGTAPIVIIAVVCIGLTFLTELTSNTATATLVLPIIANAAPGLGIDPRALMIPATLSASCAFMMPVSSPTQAIVFGSGHVRIADMVRAGFWLNGVGVIVVVGLFWLLAGPAMGIDIGSVPAWATP
ncbi:MAG: SLC13/DASS family transporter [Myxococcales bacterium]|nr:SLC13/DASS family transporter [Myxococcales bacterium]